MDFRTGMVNSSSNGLRINLFGDSFTGRYTTGCTHLKMFAKPLKPTWNSSCYFSHSFQKKLSWGSFRHRDFALLQLYFFPGCSRLYAQKPSCSDPLIWVPASLVSHLVLVLRSHCPVSLLTLSCSMCQTVCLGWPWGWDFKPIDQPLFLFYQLRPLTCPVVGQASAGSFFSLDWNETIASVYKLSWNVI